jgi:hypothetical protein
MTKERNGKAGEVAGKKPKQFSMEPGGMSEGNLIYPVIL